MWQAVVSALGTTLGLIGATVAAEVLRERYRQRRDRQQVGQVGDDRPGCDVEPDTLDGS
jgi:hypothetical protein